MDTLGIMWRGAGFLGASIVIILLAYVLYCVIKAVAEGVRKGRRGNGK